MRRLAVVALLLSIAKPATADASIVLDQPSPHLGDFITFTETYPKEATQGGRVQQFPWQPNTQVQCYSSVDGSEVLNTFTAILKDTALGNGMRGGTTEPLQMNATGSCFATLFTLTEHRGQVTSTIWAVSRFEVV